MLVIIFLMLSLYIYLLFSNAKVIDWPLRKKTGLDWIRWSAPWAAVLEECMWIITHSTVSIFNP